MNHSRVSMAGVGLSKVISFEVPCAEISRSGMAHVVLTPERALELACWIVALCDPNETRFDEILRQIEDG